MLAVTGATGFIGRRLIPAALGRGWAVRALVRHPSHIRAAANLAVHQWDAVASDTFTDLLTGVDAVCHLAAFVPSDNQEPTLAERCFRVNALGTLSLVIAAAKAGVRRFVHFSSGNAYAPERSLVDEDHPLYPSWQAPYYLTSKVTSEVFVDHWRRIGRLSACILRLASVYGPGMTPTSVIPTFATRLRAGQPITLRNGGCHTADFVFVDDVVTAALAAAETDVDGPFNIGSGVVTTIRELAEALVTVVGAEADLVAVEPPRNGPCCTGFAGLNLVRARAELGYRPTPLCEGLERYVKSLSPDP